MNNSFIYTCTIITNNTLCFKRKIINVIFNKFRPSLIFLELKNSYFQWVCIFLKKNKNIFRQTSTFFQPVDNLINIIPIELFEFPQFINKLTTTYPPEVVDK